VKPALLLLTLAPLWAQAPLKVAVTTTEKLVLTRQAITDAENRLNGKLAAVGTKDDRVYILGLTRGLHLEGYGVVFTAELDLIESPSPNPFRQVIGKEEAARVHQRKVANLALLRKALRDMWVETATSLAAVPENDQVVIAVRLLYQPAWEDTSGLPAQIVLKGPRKAALNGSFQTEEQ
jgi:hypothetical protein